MFKKPSLLSSGGNGGLKNHSGVTLLKRELNALLTATELAMNYGMRDVQVETDATRSLDIIWEDSGKYTGVRSFRSNAYGLGYSFNHVFREGNTTAHCLASQRNATAQIVLFDRVCHLPIMVKRSYFADLFDLPHLRF
ncbi:unnamed protein product [Cuscuta epithymum]|uniref:RNase H type-1 domain-containing protein n=1 Tax=Cuscuta epithymum TaxID=186058 RepID=A0AAV0EZN2_9ASTE|nr:unnamed protein product [Cuscuta epithymum]